MASRRRPSAPASVPRIESSCVTPSEATPRLRCAPRHIPAERPPDGRFVHGTGIRCPGAGGFVASGGVSRFGTEATRKGYTMILRTRVGQLARGVAGLLAAGVLMLAPAAADAGEIVAWEGSF